MDTDGFLYQSMTAAVVEKHGPEFAKGLLHIIVTDCVAQLKPKADPTVLEAACGRLLTTAVADKGVVNVIVAAGGVAALLEVLAEQARCRPVVETASLLLKQINFVLDGPPGPLSHSCVPTAVAALRALLASDVERASTQVCVSLWCLFQTGGKAVAEAVAAAGGGPVLLATLRANPASADVAQLGNLAELCEHVPATVPAMVSEGAVPLLLELLRRHASTPEVIPGVLFVTARMLLCEPSLADAFSPVVPLVVAALRAHVGNSRVAEFAIRCLKALIPETAVGAANTAALVAAGAIPALAGVLRAQLANRRTCAFVCSAIGDLACTSANQAEAIAAGGVELCLAVLKTHADVLVASADACRLASTIAVTEPATAALLTGGFPAMALRTCRKFFSDGQLRTVACYALSGIVKHCTADFPPSFAADVVATVVESFQLHASREDTVVAAGKASLDACMRLPGLGNALVAAGAVAAMLSAWRVQLASWQVACAVPAALAQLAHKRTPATAVDVTAAGGMEMAVVALRKHVESAQAADCVVSLLGSLAGVAANRKVFFRSGAVPAILSALRAHPTLSPLPNCVLRALGAAIYHGEDCNSTAMTETVQARYFNSPAHAAVVLPCVRGGCVPALLSALANVCGHAPRSRVCLCPEFALVNALAASKDVLPPFLACPLAVRAVIDVACDQRYGCPGSTFYGLAAACHLASHSGLASRMIDAGLGTSLVRSLGGKDSTIGVQALLRLALLVRLTSLDAGRTAIVAGGGIEALHAFLHLASTHQEATSHFMQYSFPVRCDLRDPLARGNVGFTSSSTTTLLRVARMDDPVAEALRALANLARSSAARAAMRRSQLLKTAVEFVHRVSSSAIVLPACALLRAYAMGDGCEDDIVAAGALPVLAAAVGSSPLNEDPAVVTEACSALWNVLGGGSAAVQRAAADEGVDSALTCVLVNHGRDSALGRLAQAALDCLPDEAK